MPAGGATPIAVLASGRGSNFDALWAAIQEGRLKARVTHVISDKETAPVLGKARAAGLTARCVLPSPALKGVERREAHEAALLETLSDDMPRWLVLAGYMRILGTKLIGAFTDGGAEYSRIVNVHPSLLPAFPGVDSYQQAFEHGCKVTGVTVHLVNQGVDEGPICAQAPVDISNCVDVAEVERRGLAVEHRLYPETLAWVLAGKFRIEDGRVCVRTS